MKTKTETKIVKTPSVPQRDMGAMVAEAIAQKKVKEDIFICEECGEDFYVKDAQIMEDKDGNEGIECPGCGEIYERLEEGSSEEKLPASLAEGMLDLVMEGHRPADVVDELLGVRKE